MDLAQLNLKAMFVALKNLGVPQKIELAENSIAEVSLFGIQKTTSVDKTCSNLKTAHWTEHK